MNDADESGTLAGWPSSKVSPSQERPLWSPRVLVSLLVTVPPLLLTIEAASRDSTWSMILPFFICAGISITWFGFFLGALWTAGGRMPLRHVVRWLVIPAVLALTFLTAVSDIPFAVRFAMSRSELDRVAADVMAGGSTDRTSIGLFPVEFLERTSDGMVLQISGGRGSSTRQMASQPSRRTSASWSHSGMGGGPGRSRPTRSRHARPMPGR